MVTYDRIYRDSRTHDCLLIFVEELKNIPAGVTKSKTYSLSLENLASLSEIIDRISCEDCMMLICLGLDVTDSEDIVVHAVTCLDEVEIEL